MEEELKYKKNRKVKQKNEKSQIRPCTLKEDKITFSLLNEIFSHLGFGARAFTGVEKKSQVFDSLHF